MPGSARHVEPHDVALVTVDDIEPYRENPSGKPSLGVGYPLGRGCR